jgi:hypothetical protein
VLTKQSTNADFLDEKTLCAYSRLGAGGYGNTEPAMIIWLTTRNIDSNS